MTKKQKKTKAETEYALAVSYWKAADVAINKDDYKEYRTFMAQADYHIFVARSLES